MKKSVWFGIGAAFLTAFVGMLFWKPQVIKKTGGTVEYHVLNHHDNTSTDWADFNGAMTAIGDVADQLDAFRLTFDGDQAADAQPYTVECGQEDPGPWFTDYSDDSPTHQPWASIEAMKGHLKHIDDTAWGRL